MKTKEALNEIAEKTMDHLSRDVIIYNPSELRQQINAILRSHAVEFASYLRMEPDVAKEEYDGWTNSKID